MLLTSSNNKVEVDIPLIMEKLAIEGYTDEDMAIWDGWNVETADGFFTLKMANNLPYLIHFLVNRGKRGGPAYLRLLRCMKNMVKNLGFKKLVINVPKDNDFTRQVVSRTFKVERPYDENMETEFYLVEV